jgi:hypothetical protein
MPDPFFCDMQCAVARVMNVSGAADVIRKMYEDLGGGDGSADVLTNAPAVGQSLWKIGHADLGQLKYYSFTLKLAVS